MKAWKTTGLIACAIAGTWAGNASAFPFEYERWTGALDSQLTAGSQRWPYSDCH